MFIYINIGNIAYQFYFVKLFVIFSQHRFKNLIWIQFRPISLMVKLQCLCIIGETHIEEAICRCIGIMLDPDLSGEASQGRVEGYKGMPHP